MKRIAAGMLMVWFCMAGLSWGQTLGDVDSDGNVGIPEAIYALQISSGMRQEVPDEANILFTHQAASGSFVKVGDGSPEDDFKNIYRLTLGNVQEEAGYSTEQPTPSSGKTTTKAVVKEFDWDPANPPTAAVVIANPVSDTQDVMLVRLMHPVYDEISRTLSFYVYQDLSYQGRKLTAYIERADNSLPESFEEASISVDIHWPHPHWPTCGRGYIGCYEHYGCCSQPTVTVPLPRFEVSKCWMWSYMKCMPCSEDPCGAQYPDQCGGGTCSIDCLNDDDVCWP